MNDGWELVYRFRVPEPIVLLNVWTRMHFRRKASYMKQWQWLLLEANKGKPRIVVHQCWIHVKRGNPKPFPDLDGLIGGLKPLLDVLVCPRLRNPYGLGFIKDDSQDFLQKLTAESVQTKPHEGFTEVEIYRPAPMARAA